jgi:hypothetical protein
MVSKFAAQDFPPIRTLEEAICQALRTAVSTIVSFEPDDQELNLSEEDQGSLAIIMKTVIDALDSSVR